ncbi:Vps36-domain-containing protein [Trichoderma citrinoviride]|uniref:Vacuolar protein-sorting-associated protein 36 n=1 Tax=Trichoderma citrinoviride TaxID=58853 RepID=A0A2T4BBX0_9HYPO|nr:Vps36-domain-containing protein [Trichoderma citrinoviride]PTB66731.1 Vps36-domain-containing protein [Trichoderma citrinoviride]
MFLKHIDLTTALRPSYLPDEVLLFVQDNVGLYEGKYKLPNQQNGQVYLTSHRICYVDKDEPRKNSVALNLKEVDRYEFYAGFLKSSAKITLVPKPLKRSTLHNRVVSNIGVASRGSTPSPAQPDNAYAPPSGPPAITTATWVCSICSFSNPVPSNFDPVSANAHTPLPPCLACGIKPTLSQLLKAAITSASNRPTALSSSGQQAPTTPQQPNLPPAISNSSDYTRTQSPGPVKDSSSKSSPGGNEFAESVKISFRGGGEKIFYERLKSAMTQRKWLLQDAPPAPKSNRVSESNSANGSPHAPAPKAKTAGIAGLEQRGLNMRKNNEILIGSAFEDLEALMASAKEVVALAERFAQQVNGASGDVTSKENSILAESAHQLGLITTKDIVGGGSSESLYLSELARNLAEFLTDDARGVLKRAGGILTLVDLWAMFNRARGGVELVSPMDFKKAAQMWETLKLPVRLRTFRSGVMVVQGRDRTDEATVRSILAWLQDLHEFPPDRDVAWDWRAFGRGVTAQEAAERFGWSLGVAEEELLMAEEQGALCREEGLEGLKFWKNYIGASDVEEMQKREAQQEADALMQRLRDTGFI